MTDLDKLTSLLDEFGVEYHLTDIGDWKNVSMRYGDRKVGGYVGFGTEFNFTSDGSFHGIGAYNTDHPEKGGIS